METREFEALVRRHTPLVRSLAYSVLRSAADADETVNEVWLKVWKAIDRYDGRSAFTTWLYRIAQNAAIDALRRRGVKEELKEEIHEESLAHSDAHHSEDPEELRRRTESMTSLRADLEQLEEHHRDTILLWVES